MRRKGKTRKELTSAAGVAPNSFVTWSKRKTIPSAYVLSVMARELGTTVEYLVYGVGPSTEPLPVVDWLSEPAVSYPRTPESWAIENKALVRDLMDMDDAGFNSVVILARGLANQAREAKKKSSAG